MNQVEWLYQQLHALRTETLIQIIDELELANNIPESGHKSMAEDVYEQAKKGAAVSHKQKRVLVNIIGQPR